jgi:hypothetical protein
MTQASLFHETDAADVLPARFSKAARAALVGLVLPPAVLALASSFGAPLRTGVTWLFILLPAAGFLASGLMAGSAFGRGWKVTSVFAGALLAGGALIGVSYRSLQGLTGRESTLLVISVPVLGFAAGLALAGLVGALALPLGWPARARIVRRSAVGGGLGGLVAAVPVLVAPPGVDHVAAQYGWMALTVASFFACLILPYRLMGKAFRDAMRTAVQSWSSATR